MPDNLQNLELVCIGFSIILVAIFITLIAIMLIFQKKIILSRNNAFIQILKAQEDEKQRIGKDLHDQVGPLLSNLKLQVNSLIYETGIESDAEKLIDMSIDHIRSASYDLMPNVLYRHGLEAAIEDFCEMATRGQRFKIKLQLSENAFEIEQNISLQLYRIIQEIINNALKHSEATLILITFICHNNIYKIEIIDNGRGFNTNENIHLGIGLKNIKYRVELINGKINYTSKPGATRYILNIPL
jgi:signal transduction histidine kinase